MNRWHKQMFAASIVLTLVSWGYSLYYWAKLPDVIPVHFGFNGQADSWDEKTIFYVFMLPILQTLFIALFAWLYKHPQYSNIPSTLWLMALDKSHRDKSFMLIRTMQIGTLVFVNLLLTYLNISMLFSGMGYDGYPSTVVMLTILAAMFIWIIWYSVRTYKIINSYVKNIKKKG